MEYVFSKTTSNVLRIQIKTNSLDTQLRQVVDTIKREKVILEMTPDTNEKRFWRTRLRKLRKELATLKQIKKIKRKE